MGFCSGMSRPALALILAIAAAAPAASQDPSRAAPGVTNTEIKIGNTAPYSGPASALSVMFKTVAAYFKKINDEGGINGRKINFLSYDDAYSPPKAFEQTRKLVEGDEVLLIFGSLGSATNGATQRYLNSRGVPQLFIMTGANKFASPQDSPWTMPWPVDFESEGQIAAAYLKANVPDPKIGIIFQNDDFGRDILKGFKARLGDLQTAIVAEEPYDTSQPTIDSAVVKLKSANATVMFAIATPKFAAQAIRKAAEMMWKPVMMVPQVSSSVAAVMQPAGAENSVGVLSWLSFKDPNDPGFKDDAGVARWSQFMTKYHPEGDRRDAGTVSGYLLAQTLEHVLKAAGNDLSRENIMRQAASLKNVALDMLLPGMALNTSATDFLPIQQAQVARFDGRSWVRMGPVIGADAPSR